MRALPTLFYTMGILSLFLALYFWLTAGADGADLASGERWAMFVAFWAPTLIALGAASAVHNLHRELLRRKDDVT